MKQVLLGGALESVLAAAAERPPSEDSPRTDTRVLLVGLRRSFTGRPCSRCGRRHGAPASQTPSRTGIFGRDPMSRVEKMLLSAAALLCAAAAVIVGQAQSLSAPVEGSGPEILGIGSYSPIVGDLERSLAFYARVGLDIPAPAKPGPRPLHVEPGPAAHARHPGRQGASRRGEDPGREHVSGDRRARVRRAQTDTVALPGSGDDYPGAARARRRRAAPDIQAGRHANPYSRRRAAPPTARGRCWSRIPTGGRLSSGSRIRSRKRPRRRRATSSARALSGLSTTPSRRRTRIATSSAASGRERSVVRGG